LHGIRFLQLAIDRKRIGGELRGVDDVVEFYFEEGARNASIDAWRVWGC
jgi:hypothetical protein